MMRAAGVPARVVAGYQGGDWNPVGGYLLVRQSDAHAWTEVWLDGQGWTPHRPDGRGRAGAPPARHLMRSFASSAGQLPRCFHAQRAGSSEDSDDVGQREPVVAGPGRANSTCARRSNLLQSLGIDIAATGSTSAGRSRSGWWPGSSGWRCPCAAACAREARSHRRAPGCARHRKLARVAPPRAASEGPLRLRATRGGGSAGSRRTREGARGAATRACASGRRPTPPRWLSLERDVRRLAVCAARATAGRRRSRTAATSEMIEARSLLVSAATTAISSGPSTVANLPIML